MSISLLSINACSYPDCGLHFQSLHDLIAHIEYVHIPVFEDQRVKPISHPPEDVKHSAPNIPLSSFHKFYPTPFPPVPSKPEIFKISFNHYRKRPVPVMAPVPNGSFMSVNNDDIMSDQQEDLDECNASDPEMRFRCPYVDCGRRYKNASGLKIHMRSAHNMSTEDGTSSLVSMDSNPPGSPAHSTSSPTKYAASRPHKCQQCSKRYKTTQGLQNHVTQSHSKPNGHTDPSSPSSAAVAQLITQVKAQAAQASQGINQHHRDSSPRVPPPLPVSAVSGVPTSFSQNPPLPVRSIQVQPNRVVTHTQGAYMSSSSSQIVPSMPSNMPQRRLPQGMPTNHQQMPQSQQQNMYPQQYQQYPMQGNLEHQQYNRQPNQPDARYSQQPMQHSYVEQNPLTSTVKHE